MKVNIFACEVGGRVWFSLSRKTTYSLDYSLTLNCNVINDIFFKAAGASEAEIDFRESSWYVEHFTTSLLKKQRIVHHFLSKNLTKTSYVRKQSLKKFFETKGICTFELSNVSESCSSWAVVGAKHKN